VAYVIRALLLKPKAAAAFSLMHPALGVIELSQHLIMAPVLVADLPKFGSCHPANQLGEDGEFDGYTVGLAATLDRVCQSGDDAAVIGAEFHGGCGTQWAVVHPGGGADARPLQLAGLGAINEALRALGVVVESGDEFETLGLGRFRSTEEWLDNGDPPDHTGCQSPAFGNR
jgi:hypothetical protein